MSDLHLVPSPELAHGLDTAERLVRGVDSINQEHTDADFCVLAGDLVERGDKEAYQCLKAIMQPLKIPYYLALGNHDDRETFLSVFGRTHCDSNGHVQRVIDQKGYRVIVLDSVEAGRHTGVLCDKRLAWLRDQLSGALDRPVIVIIHHHVNKVRFFMDEYLLENPNELLDVLHIHPDVRHVISGHVHISTTGVIRGIPFTTVAGGHYTFSVSLGSDSRKEVKKLEGPAQYAVVLADEASVTVHFHNYIDQHTVLSEKATN
jgi:3',5'-cyclic AMP phosphodiesterase CpdA